MNYHHRVIFALAFKKAPPPKQESCGLNFSIGAKQIRWLCLVCSAYYAGQGKVKGLWICFNGEHDRNVEEGASNPGEAGEGARFISKQHDKQREAQGGASLALQLSDSIGEKVPLPNVAAALTNVQLSVLCTSDSSTLCSAVRFSAQPVRFLRLGEASVAPQFSVPSNVEPQSSIYERLMVRH